MRTGISLICFLLALPIVLNSTSAQAATFRIETVDVQIAPYTPFGSDLETLSGSFNIDVSNTPASGPWGTYTGTYIDGIEDIDMFYGSSPPLYEYGTMRFVGGGEIFSSYAMLTEYYYDGLQSDFSNFEESYIAIGASSDTLDYLLSELGTGDSGIFELGTFTEYLWFEDDEEQDYYYAEAESSTYRITALDNPLSVTPVPLPGTLPLLGLALGGMSLLRRRGGARAVRG